MTFSVNGKKRRKQNFILGECDHKLRYIDYILSNSDTDTSNIYVMTTLGG